MKEIEVTVIGVGSVGRVMAAELAKTAGYSVTLLDKQYPVAALWAKKLHVQAIRSLSEISPRSRYILLTVPDREIRKVAHQLAGQELVWGKLAVMHTSGSLGTKELDKLALKGTGIAAFHPYQTFPKNNKNHNLQDITFGIEGNSRGIAAAKTLAKALGGKSLLVPPDKRTLYHLSAVLASGFIATDLWMATHILQSLGIKERQAQGMLLPIVLRTVINSVSKDTGAAITGPAARGDRAAIQRHQKALRKDFPELVKAYREMSQLMMVITNKSNKHRK